MNIWTVMPIFCFGHSDFSLPANTKFHNLNSSLPPPNTFWLQHIEPYLLQLPKSAGPT